jgi:hypothetical protein
MRLEYGLEHSSASGKDAAAIVPFCTRAADAFFTSFFFFLGINDSPAHLIYCILGQRGRRWQTHHDTPTLMKGRFPVKKLFAMLLVAGLLGSITGCPQTPTTPAGKSDADKKAEQEAAKKKADEAKKKAADEEAKKKADEAAKKDDVKKDDVKKDDVKKDDVKKDDVKKDTKKDDVKKDDVKKDDVKKDDVKKDDVKKDDVKKDDVKKDDAKVKAVDSAKAALTKAEKALADEKDEAKKKDLQKAVDSAKADLKKAEEAK